MKIGWDQPESSNHILCFDVCSTGQEKLNDHQVTFLCRNVKRRSVDLRPRVPADSGAEQNFHSLHLTKLNGKMERRTSKLNEYKDTELTLTNPLRLWMPIPHCSCVF